MIKKYLLTAFLFTTCLANHSYAFDPTFDVEVNLGLCPEYEFGGVSVEFYYTIGNTSQKQQAQVISATPDLPNKSYKAILRFPADRGTNDFTVTSHCKSSKGLSSASNEIAFSNCTKLALYDTDFDGISNEKEDTNCDNFFSPGDYSNPDNIDSDGDGVADLVELVSNTSPTNQGNSPRPFIVSYASFDPDGDGVSNPVVWRPSNGTWYYRSSQGQAVSFPFGNANDIPFTYRDFNQQSNVGVVRRSGNDLIWYFRGNGFPDLNGQNGNQITFGSFGDIIIPGAWEKPGITNPAIARLFGGIWDVYILMSDRSIKRIVWGGNGDIPKPQDLNGDGIIDFSVYRPATQSTYVTYTNLSNADTFKFGTGTSDFTVKGDYTGDGIEDLAFWEPIHAKFFILKSDLGFNVTQGQLKNPLYYFETQLGEYFNDLPLSWNNDGNKDIFTTINHFSGTRKYLPQNNPSLAIQSFQWGLYGDFQG